MPRKEKQKAKILILLKILEQRTDEEHRMTVPQILDALAQEGVPSERKSVYSDIATLRAMGCDVELQRGPGGGYYIANRRFQLPELKLLVDAVQSSQFITRRKSRELIGKLSGLASEYQAQKLRRQVFVSGRAKSMNESAYYTVDVLYEAIDSDRMVEFRYSDWGLDRRRHPRRGGKPYRVSPWALVWENNSYYLIAYEDYEEPYGIRHYRVDKMSAVKKTEVPRRGKELYDQFDLSAYVQSMFNMYGGPVRKVTLQCENRLASAMLDRFGTGVNPCVEEDGQHFHITVPVAVSPQFLGWICGFGTAVRILEPEEVCAQMTALAAGLARLYPPAAPEQPE